MDPLLVGGDLRGPVSHQDAIRARREALEQARKQTLQRALNKGGKTGAMNRDEEIASIEQQLVSGSRSAAALVGLKKRLASLRAAGLREERAAAAAKRSAAPPADVASLPREQVVSEHDSAPSGRNSPAADSDWGPETARPPPREEVLADPAPQLVLRPSAREEAAGGVRSPDWQDDRRPCNGAWAVPGYPKSPLARAISGRKRQPSATLVGAASAPWANDFSNKVAAAR